LNQSTLKTHLIDRAKQEGFATARLCLPNAIPDVPTRLSAFLKNGFHGQMAWLADRTDWRSDPQVLWPEAKSIVMLCENYAPKHDPLEILEKKDRGAISVYAQGRDYHDVLKKRLKRVARWLVAESGCEVKVFVDTAPVSEKPLAQAAGLGWQGKHTNLVSRELGNWFFLGAIFTTLELEPDEPETDHCGSCRACLDICPTDAFPAPYQLDARRCISYLTIEHKGPVDEELRPILGNRIFGCDDCLAVCPWNKFAKDASEQRYAARDDLGSPALGELVQLRDEEFRSKFSGSPIKRLGRNRLVRNVLYAIGNSGDEKFNSEITHLALDPDPTVADAASWAIERLKAPKSTN